MCLDLRRKMVTCSRLLRWLTLSFREGVVMCWNMVRPVVPVAHRFIQSSFMFCLMICLVVLYDTGWVCCWYVAPCFANLSALSFPVMLACPGIHCKRSLTLWAVRNSWMVSDKLSVEELSSFSFLRASRTDLESVKMTMFWLLVGQTSKMFEMWWTAASIAIASAS